MTCVEWLKKELKGKDVILCDEIRKKSRKAGFSKKELREARAVLGVKTWHQINEDSDVNWFWYLPEEQNADA